jgi:hypothetical protein
METKFNNLSPLDRASRTVLGFALIGIAYFGTGFLGYLALLPIVAIVPLMTAALGYCPVENTIARAWHAGKPVVRAPGHGGHYHSA